MAIISPYQDGIASRTIKPYKTNTELEFKVLAHRQGQYDAAYAGLQQLRKDALSIQFINKKEQGKIDSFNSKIAEQYHNLQGEMGDLSNAGIAASYSNLFNEIGQDRQLIARYHKDKELATQLQDVYGTLTWQIEELVNLENFQNTSTTRTMKTQSTSKNCTTRKSRE